MRRRTFAALGFGATASVTAAALMTGVVPTSLGGLVPPLTSPAAAAELRPFDNCDQLLDWYIDAALPRVTAWGLDWPMLAADVGGGVVELQGRAEAGVAESAPSTGDAVGSGGTGTNIQEAGVDEPDSAKTDGRLVAHVDRHTVFLTDASGDEPRELSRVRLPRDLNQPKLLLVGDRLVVMGQSGYGFGPRPFLEDRIIGPSVPQRAKTKVLVLDISIPSAPRTVHETSFDGDVLSARQYDDVIRLVTSTSTPRLKFVFPDQKRSQREALRENRQILRASSIEDWLPGSDSGDPLVECTDVHHPAESAGFGTISVVTFTADDPDQRSATAVTATGHQVYSSTDRLYIATTTGGWWDGPIPVDARGPERDRPKQPATEVHAFALAGTDTDYVASGEVPGWVRDRWSFSEYDGHLRVATALGRNSWEPEENGIVVLEERGDALIEIGRVDKMGIKEQIQSVRWFGDIAVVVTFRRIDPLYTVDLSDPTAPAVLGELKIPGFSSYLHPIGDDRLLGLGQDADLDGRTRGAQAAVFDLADLSDPRRLDTETFGKNTEFAAAWDARAFTYLPDQRTAISPLQDYLSGGIRLAVIEIRENGTLRRSTTDVVGTWSDGTVRTLPLDNGEIALVVGAEVTKPVL